MYSYMLIPYVHMYLLYVYMHIYACFLGSLFAYCLSSPLDLNTMGTRMMFILHGSMFLSLITMAKIHLQ